MNETYNQQHQRCPRCGGLDITRTWSGERDTRGEPYRDNDGAACKSCGWDGIVHYLVPEKQDATPPRTDSPQQAEDPLTLTFLLLELRRRESLLSEERSRKRLAKYRKLVKEYMELVHANLDDWTLIAVEAAHAVAKQIKETEGKTPTDDEILQLSILCGPRINIPERFETLYTALHGPGA